VTGTEKVHIFYIEDDPDMIALVRIILDAERFEVASAANGCTGLALMRHSPPDLVLLDLMLPDMGGWAVYQAMKEDTDLRELPVIVVTAQNTPIDRILGEHIARVQVYITKPFTPQELRTAVDTVLTSPGLS
jgi:two-component system, OmpR family, response regulator VicR